MNDDRAVRRVTAAAAAVAGFAATWLLHNSDALTDAVATPLIMHAIRTADFRFAAFRAVDDPATAPRERIPVVVGVILQENCALVMAALAVPLAVPPLRRLLRGFFVDRVAPRVRALLLAVRLRFGSSRCGCPFGAADGVPAAETRDASFTRAALSAGACGLALGVAAWHAAFVPPSALRHVLVPLAQAALNLVPAKVPPSTVLDFATAGALGAAFVANAAVVAWPTRELADELVLCACSLTGAWIS
jgi:hypothetical protein